MQSVADIICGNIKKDYIPSCTDIGGKIANNLIRVASERIFVEPEQSIMELPVNSVDSYNTLLGKSGSIGKFGMGFYSIFYWLLTVRGSRLTISSLSVLKDHSIPYTVMLTWDNEKGLLIANVEPEDFLSGAAHGTKISLFNETEMNCGLSKDQVELLIEEYKDDITGLKDKFYKVFSEKELQILKGEIPKPKTIFYPPFH
jgi:hypothetical protein